MGILNERRRGWLGTLGAVLLGVVLLVAAWTKAIHPDAFVEQIAAEGLDFWLSARTVAYVALAVEIFLGIALLLNVRRWWVLAPAAALVVFFLFLTGKAYVADLRGLEPASESCGCFGNLVDRTPAEAFWGDLLLLVPPLLLAWFARPGAESATWRTTAAGALALAGVGFATKAPELPLDDLATRLKPGVETHDLCAGRPDDVEYVCLDALVPELDDGEHWVVLTQLAEPAFLEGVTPIHEHTLAAVDPPVWLVSDVEPEALNIFTWQHMMATEVRLVPPSLMSPLFRALPRSFRVVDGEVVETLQGMPPLAASVAPAG